MPEYKFDLGNSNDGQSGCVAYVKATSPKAAVKKLQVLAGLSGAFDIKTDDIEVSFYIANYDEGDIVEVDGDSVENPS